MLSRSIVLQSLRSIRDRFFDTGRQRNEQNDVGAETSHDVKGPSLDNLSVDMQFHIMTFLSPQDLCRLGGTSTYWRSMVRDPVLWKYFLLRDMPLWKSVDHLSMPEIKLSGTSMLGDPEMNHFDYMAEYLRVCPACRNHWRQQRRATFESVTSFFHFLVPGTAEPQFVMFGPGLEQLEVSLMTRIMNSPHVLPIAGMPQHQIEGSDQSWEEESAQIRVMLDPAVGSVSRPILVLSCISRETADTHRIPCVTVADHLQLSSLSNPWMVQDTAAESLTGLLDGIDWLMRNSDVRL